MEKNVFGLIGGGLFASFFNEKTNDKPHSDIITQSYRTVLFYRFGDG